MRQTVLISGGAGYVGGRIAKALIGSGKYTVRIGTHRAPEALPAWTRQCEIVPLDVRSPEDTAAACASVDMVVHLAAMNENDSAVAPDQALIVNTMGTLHTLAAAQAAGAKRFLYVSTAHVYSSPLSGVITEQTVTRPVHPYAITHRAAEDFVSAAHQRGQLCGIVVRLSNGYGSPADTSVDRWTLLANDLCRQAVMHGKLVLRSSGIQRRDFVSLSDVAGAVEHLLAMPASRVGDGLFNLGGENPMRVIDMAEFIADRSEITLGSRPNIIRPQPAADETGSDLDYKITKLKATGFHLRSDMTEEIDETLRMCERICAGARQ